MDVQLTTGDAALILNLVLVLSALTVGLIGAVIGFKVSRDAHERRSAAMQVRILDAWETGDNVLMRAVALDILKGGIREQSDLAAVCNRTVGAAWWTPDRVARVQQSLIDAGLAAQLQRQLGSGRAIRRGLAVYIAGFPCWHVDPMDIVRFTHDDEPTVRMAAVAALERMATRASAQALIVALERAHLPRARIIERLGHAWAVEPMLEALRAPDQAWEVRCDLLRAMSFAADPRTVPAALEIATDLNKYERMQAMRVLASTFTKASPEQQERIEAVAIAATDDEHPNVRSAAVEVLRQIPHSAELERLAVLVADPDWFVRRRAARALAGLGDAGRERLQGIAAGSDRFAAERAREELDMHAALPSYQSVGA